MATDLFEFSDYRVYLKKEFSGTGAGRGKRAHLAEALGCQTSFLSQVLTDRAHLSLEHAMKASGYLAHSDAERDYFMLLVQKAKAGSRSLTDYFDTKLREIRESRDRIQERIRIKTDLTAEDQMRYYSSWFYSAIHILASLPELNAPAEMAKRLRLDLTLVKDVLGFLEEKGFVSSSQGKYKIGNRRIHLAHGSPMLPRHHANWRMKAIEAVDHEKPQDLHYSAVLGIAKADIPLFREKMLKLIADYEPLVTASKEDSPVILLMDLFEL